MGRRAGLLIAGMLAAAWLACEVDVAHRKTHAPSGWRRGRDGWERCETWQRVPPAAPPALHPAVVGLFQLLASAWALLALPPAVSSARRGGQPATFDLAPQLE